MEEFAKQLGTGAPLAITLALLCWRVWRLEVGQDSIWELLNGGKDSLSQRLARLEGEVGSDNR